MASGSELPLELSGLGLVAGSLTIPSLEDDANRRQVYHPKPTTATQLAHNTRNWPHSAFRFESPCDHFPLVGQPEVIQKRAYGKCLTNFWAGVLVHILHWDRSQFATARGSNLT